MAHQRGHREQGDLEVGATDVFIRHPTPHVAPRDDRPQWLINYEAKRPRWLMEMLAEAFGVFLYCWGGMGATAAFYTSVALKEEGFGNLLTVGLSYAFAIALAVTIVGPTSGSHINPCFTICFAVWKGFPWRKVPQYIVAQIFGGMIAGLLVYAQYRTQLHAITEELTAAGLSAQVCSSTGPASPIALFPNPALSLGSIFVNEFIGAFVIAVAVFSILDSSNIFVSPTAAPLLIGYIYFVTITCYAGNSVALNTARDVGGRLAAGIIWGRKAFPAGYSALAALTNIAASLCGSAFQIFILSDSNRPAVKLPETEAPVTSASMPSEKEINDYMSKHGTSHEEHGQRSSP